MKTQRVARTSGEVRENPKYKPSTLTEPIPYYPGLNDECGGVTAAILFTYLETHYPAPVDTSPQRFQRITSLPVRIDSERVCADLQVSRRTLVINLSRLAVWFNSEPRRSRAHGASREFIQPLHRRYSKIKPYSVVGPKSCKSGFIAYVRRNVPRVQSMLQRVNLVVSSPSSAPQSYSSVELKGAGVPVFAPSALPGNRKIADLLDRASVLAGDRRKTRYKRAKVAAEAGIVPDIVTRRIAEKSASSRGEGASS